MLDNTSPASSVELTVGGLTYGGWKAARVVRGIDRLAGDFTLEVTELWPGQDRTRQIRPGDACVVRVAGRAVLTGFVDAVELAIDERDHVVTIKGRDRAADLMDCSAVASPGQWRQQPLLAIARALTAPFGIPVSDHSGAPSKPLASFSLQEGESVYEAIDRAARLRGLLVVSNGTGAIEFTSPGVGRSDDLVLGDGNVLQGRGTFDVRDRYQTYIAKGQSPGSDDWNGRAAAAMRAEAKDPEIQRYRPLVLTGEAPDTGAALSERALWEATVRRAKSMQVELVVQGFAQRSGALWQPNTLARVSAPALRLDQDLLVVSTTFLVSSRGTFTELALMPADAFAMEPISEPRASTGKGSGPGAGEFWDRAGGAR